MRADFTKWFEDWKQACGKWNNSMHGGARDAWDHQQVRVAALEAELGAARAKLEGLELHQGDELPWWYPVKTDEAWLERIREENPEMADITDKMVRFLYADGAKYTCLSDEPRVGSKHFDCIADAYLDLVKAISSTGDDS